MIFDAIKTTKIHLNFINNHTKAMSTRRQWNFKMHVVFYSLIWLFDHLNQLKWENQLKVNKLEITAPVSLWALVRLEFF